MGKKMIGVDLDGTLAYWDMPLGIYDPMRIGNPIYAMVDRVNEWLEQGHEVVIFTARVYPDKNTNVEVIRNVIKEWCLLVFGCELEVTCMKNPRMIEIWDDRAVAIEHNTGRVISPIREDLHFVDNQPDALGSLL